VSARPSGKGNLPKRKTFGIEVGKVMDSELFELCNEEKKREAVLTTLKQIIKHKFSSYITVNTSYLHYKNQSTIFFRAKTVVSLATIVLNI
jgi:hypothetical protein